MEDPKCMGGGEPGFHPQPGMGIGEVVQKSREVAAYPKSIGAAHNAAPKYATIKPLNMEWNISRVPCQVYQ